MKKTIVSVILGFSLLPGVFQAHAQWNDGVLIDVQEINIAKMKAVGMSGAEAALKVLEQYADGRYRFAFVSYNCLLQAEQRKNLNLDKKRFMAVVTLYPEQNNLLYAQVFFDKSFFCIALAKEEHDMKKTGDVQIIKMNYEKGNAVRRNNVRDTIQRNNIIPLGID